MLSDLLEAERGFIYQWFNCRFDVYIQSDSDHFYLYLHFRDGKVKVEHPDRYSLFAIPGSGSLFPVYFSSQIMP